MPLGEIHVVDEHRRVAVEAQREPVVECSARLPRGVGKKWTLQGEPVSHPELPYWISTPIDEVAKANTRTVSAATMPCGPCASTR